MGTQPPKSDRIIYEKDPYSIGMYADLFKFQGGVFVNFGRDSKTRVKRMCERDPELWRCENDWNHYHFDYAFSKDRIENFHLNRAFAEAAQKLWEYKLAQLDGHAAKLLLVNELTEVLRGPEEADNEVYFVIYPTLRLWSRTESSRELEQIYGETNAENAFDRSELRFVPLAKAFDLVRSTADVQPEFGN